jgi:hypothetical protein
MFACAPRPAPAPATRAAVDGAIAPALSPRNASYAIEARLDPAARTIAGSAAITWRNITANPTNELQFHLYWNAWKDGRSTFLRESTVTRPIALRPDDLASIDVSAVRLVAPAAADLTPTRRFVTTDGGRVGDETVLAVDLPAPIGSGEEVRVEIAWTARVPRTRAARSRRTACRR